jgi:hypothetical protein
MSPRWFRLSDRSLTRGLMLAAFLLSAAVMVAFRPFIRMERGDPAIYDYIAQSILRGEMPYRDVIDPKAPGSMYLSAAAMATGRLFGLRDILAVRVLHILMMGLLGLVTYLVAETTLRNRMAANLAFLIPLMSEKTASWMIEGTQPKLPMILFGMTAVLFISKDKPFLAGWFSMLSCLCWQPGLLFGGTALLVFSRYLTRWRDGRAIKVVAGAIVPLALVILYYYLRGALGPLYDWTLEFPYAVFGPNHSKALGSAVSHMWIVVTRVYGKDVLDVCAERDRAGDVRR